MNRKVNVDIIAHQAKSFYNAYIVLEQMSNQNETDSDLFTIPMIVNGAFSIEVSIKALLTVFGIEYNNEHNLYILFELLPAELRTLLLKYIYIKAPFPADEKTCYIELMLLSNAFENWRYCYEKTESFSINLGFLSAFANMAVWAVFVTIPSTSDSLIKNVEATSEIAIINESLREYYIKESKIAIDKAKRRRKTK